MIAPMPKLRILIQIADATEDVLRNQLDGLHAWRNLTQSQCDAVMQNLLPLLPIDVKLEMRSPLSIAYVTAGATRFRIERQGKLNPKPWNPNPRQPAKNPWAD
jgi:hypothetical protein